jgi:hypothetical protein
VELHGEGVRSASAPSREKFGIIATTYRNPSTYALLQATMAEHGLLYMDNLGSLLQNAGVDVLPVLDLGLPGQALPPGRHNEHDVRLELVLHASVLPELGIRSNSKGQVSDTNLLSVGQQAVSSSRATGEENHTCQLQRNAYS